VRTVIAIAMLAFASTAQAADGFERHILEWPATGDLTLWMGSGSPEGWAPVSRELCTNEPYIPGTTCIMFVGSRREQPIPCEANLYSKVGDKFVCVSGGWIVNDDTVISHGQFGAPIAKPEYAPITPGYGVGEGMRNGPSHGYPNLGGPPQ
jgi:hypothetical protein